MQLFLHIRVIKDQFIFQNEVISTIRQLMPHVSVFDLDNFSDGTTVHTAIKAIQMAETIFLFIEAEPGEELGGASKILNQIIKISSPVAILYKGEHEILDKIMRRFKDKLINADMPLEDALKIYF